MDSPLSSGTKLGRYEIRSKIGQGGMGEVYLAEDTQLGRRVAIKFLPPELVADERANKRLAKEARAAATLDHPNICSIYEVGEADGRSFIAMQYLEGETLDARLKSKPLELKESLTIAAQIADALAEAHAHGIIHRDIKPGNVMITSRGQAKVMDFGLARVITGAVESEAETQSLLTAPGTIMGTMPYMSPEQVRGEVLDGRSDIFSFGVVLYEMLSGRQPFVSESAAATASAILTHEPPPLVRFSPEVPRELERMVTKALRKNREERYQGVRDLALDLKNLKEELEFEVKLGRSQPRDSSRAEGVTATGGGLAETPAHAAVNTEKVAAITTTPTAQNLISKISQHKLAAALVLGMIIVLAAAWYLLSRPRSGTKEVSLKNAAFTQLTDQPGPEYFPSLSPDGKSFVYASYASGNWDIYLQRVGGKNPINLTKDSSADDTQPAFSPDGERIVFRSEREGGGIFVMGATGESVKRLTDFGYNPAWSPDGQEIAYAQGRIAENFPTYGRPSQLWSVNVATGAKRLVTQGEAAQPQWSPHGVRIAYWNTAAQSGGGAQRDIWTIPASGGDPVPVTNDPATDWNPVWSPDGKYLYFSSERGGSMNLWRVPIEENSGKVLGPPEAVTTPSPYSGQMSFSSDGRRMAYVQMITSRNIQRVGFDPARGTVVGQPTWVTQGSTQMGTHDLSRDGEWVAFSSVGGQEDIFLIRSDGTARRQLTDDIYKDRWPRWSLDGKRIFFTSDRSGKLEIWTINTDGSGLQQITYAPDMAGLAVLSPDGTRLAYRNLVDPPYIIELGKPWQEQSPQRLPPMSNSEGQLGPWSWSPDGRKLAGNHRATVGPGYGCIVYSLETQQYEKLTDFGAWPVWMSDSRRLLFHHQGKIYLVDSQTKKVHEVLSVAPHNIGQGLALSQDDRLIYFSLETTEADIWLMTME